MATTISKEMGLTIAEFMRTLPSAVAGQPFETTQEGGVRLRYADDEGARELLIALSPQPDRCIASIRLPVTRVALTFQDFSEVQVERFMQRFNLYFHKGGG